MSTQIQTKSGKNKQRAIILKTNTYDRASSLLISLLILIGLIVGIMFAMWLTSRIVASPPAIPFSLDDLKDGDGEPEGGTKLDAPPADVLGMETDIEQPQLQETLASVASAVAASAATLDTPMPSDAEFTGKGGSTGDGRGKGHGSGTGTGGKARRWELLFDNGNSLQEYAKQLDYFNIELGCLFEGGNLVYAKNLAAAHPTSRLGKTADEKRYYLTWRNGGLVDADIELLEKTGVKRNFRDGIIIKFIPPETELLLYNLEQGKAGKNAKNVKTTKFGILKDGTKYKFFIVEQTYKI